MTLTSSSGARFIARAAVAGLLAVGLQAGPGQTTVVAAPANAALTVAPNPTYRADQPFQGWGTSLAWFANATGGYPGQVREELYL